MSRAVTQPPHEGPTNPKFLPEMKQTHKLLVPQMAPIHFRIIMDVLRQEGYDIEVLENDGPGVVHEGLQYVHNDACYPCLLVVGQFIDALKSGKYDLNKTALVITQTGGGCRASNYIHLLRKALVKAGFSQIPVASINFSSLEKDSGLSLPLRALYKLVAACLYGDALMALANQIRPYECQKGASDSLVTYWQDKIETFFARGKGTSKKDMRETFDEMANDFTHVPVVKRPTYKVGIVGEIYVKYSPLGNNRLEAFLQSEDCEVRVPGLMGFVQYCIFNLYETVNLYGGSRIAGKVSELLMKFTIAREKLMLEAIGRHPSLKLPGTIEDTIPLAERLIGMGVKMGEGWLLTGEMAELVEAGFTNVICTQPFGCLPNHVAGRGMIAKIRSAYPHANITPIDYDPGATRVNQENRIKLMLTNAEKIKF